LDKKINQEIFGAHAETYINSPTHAKGASLQRLTTLVAAHQDWTTLDIATGTGHTALAFAPRVRWVTATDITARMLQLTRQAAADRGLKNMVFAFADAEKLPYRDQSFNLVTCRIAAHHFSDILAFVRESRRVLRPDGFLALVDNIVPPGSAGDYINAFEKLRDPSHGQCLSMSDWRDLLVNTGLVVQHEETLFKELDFAYWAQRHDSQFQRFLLAMLSEVRGEAASFLSPSLDQPKRTFLLCEGIFIARVGDAL
jgi:ubiquinone/menaquinone biosynthesis C-methylase UbiE